MLPLSSLERFTLGSIGEVLNAHRSQTRLIIARNGAKLGHRVLVEHVSDSFVLVV